MLIPVESILPNPEQPRKNFDQEEMESLIESVKQHGVITPITVEQAGDHYILIDGERRWRAAKAAGLKEIEASIRANLNGQGSHERLVLAIVANVQRSNMNPIEQGLAFKKLADQAYSVADISTMVNLGVGQVRRYMSVLDMEPEIQDLYRTGKLSFETHGVQALQKIEDSAQRVKVAQAAAKQGVSGPQISNLVKRMNYIPPKASKPGPKPKHTEPTISHSDRLQASGGHWNMIAQIGRRPSDPHLTELANETCKNCQLYDIASKTTCRDCPAVDLLKRLMGGQS